MSPAPQKRTVESDTLYLRGKKKGAFAASSFMLSLLLHISMVMVFVFIAPLFGKKERLPEVYTVRLFYPKEKRSVRTKRPTPGLEKKERKQFKPKQVKKKVSQNKLPSKKVKKQVLPKKRQMAKKKVLSTRPIPSKKKKPKRKQISNEALLQKRLKEIQERVREKKEEAYLAKRLRALEKKVEASQPPVSARGSGPSSGENEALRRYFTMVWAIIRENWILPTELLKGKNLRATVVLRVSDNGKILKTWFEKRSGDAVFDQSVKKAIDAVKSLPPIPKGLGPGPVEIGVNFKPEGL